MNMLSADNLHTMGLIQIVLDTDFLQYGCSL